MSHTAEIDIIVFGELAKKASNINGYRAANKLNLHQIVRSSTVTCVITSRKRSEPTMYSRASSAVSHHFSFWPSASAIQYFVPDPKTPYFILFQINNTYPPCLKHHLKSLIVLNLFCSGVFDLTILFITKQAPF